MKKHYIIATVLLSTIAYSQVGVNTEVPKTTLDVTAKRDIAGNITDNTQLIGLQAPRLTRAELTANTATYGTDQKSALVYITDVSGGNVSGQRINVTAVGYYYFDGSLWQAIRPATFTADVRRIGTNHISEDAGVGSNGTSIPGNHNVAIGAGAMKNAVDGGFPSGFLGNIAIGGGDQLATITGAGNVAIGYSNLTKATSGTNIALGALNLQNATTADSNYIVGAQNMNAVTTAGSNLVMGTSNLNALTTGSNNYVFGFGGLNAVTTQTQNIAIGSNVLPSAVGDKNIGVGSTVLTALGTGTDNVGLGVASGGSLTTGNYNTFFGTEAGNRILGLAGEKYTSGSNSLFLGSQTKAQNAVSNQLNIQNYIYGVSGLLAFGDFTGSNALVPATERLDVTQGNVRIRNINSSVGSLTTDRIVVSDTSGVLKTVPVTSVDTIVGNEVTDATTNGGLVRAGGGTAASPYTLGLTSGTSTGDLMTWNGTAWVPSAAINIYNANGTLTSARTLTQNAFSLTFLGTNQSTMFSSGGGIRQNGVAGSKRADLVLTANDNDSNVVVSSLSIFQDPESLGQVIVDKDSRGLSIGSSFTTQPAPITFYTAPGGNVSGTEKMRITGGGNIGMNVTTPTEKLHSNGNVRLQGLPLNGTTNAIYTTSAGAASATQNQTFTATRTVVADANGVLGYVTTLPSDAGTTKVVVNVSVPGTQNLKNAFTPPVTGEFTNESIDTYNAWNNNVFTVPANLNGLYSVVMQNSSSHTSTGLATPTFSTIAFFEKSTDGGTNWTELMRHTYSDLPGTIVDNGNIVYWTGFLNVGDQVRVRLNCNSTTDNIIKNGGITITKIAQ